MKKTRIKGKNYSLQINNRIVNTHVSKRIQNKMSELQNENSITHTSQHAYQVTM